MANEKRLDLIDRNALKHTFCSNCNAEYSEEPCEPSECLFCNTVDQQPTVDAVEVSDPELLKAIKLLIKQYEHSKQSDYVHNPIAHAFYHTWKQLDERRKERQ